jgi:hypothetical protein
LIITFSENRKDTLRSANPTSVKPSGGGDSVECGGGVETTDVAGPSKLRQSSILGMIFLNFILYMG